MKKRTSVILGAVICSTTSIGLLFNVKFASTDRLHAGVSYSISDNTTLLRSYNNVNSKNDVPKLPILLLSGVLGGAVKNVGAIGPKVEYFRGIPEAMKQYGATVFDPYTPPTSSIEKRAKLVAQAVDNVLAKTGANKVHLIAHSMGGLDGRYYISTLNGGSKVASLITIGTPHHGSDFADYSFEKLGEKSNDIEHFMDNELGITVECFRQLTSTYLKQFKHQTHKKHIF